MTMGMPDWASEIPSAPVHQEQPNQLVRPFTAQQLIEFGKELIEQFIKRVVLAVAGAFIPGEAAFEQLVAWGERVSAMFSNLAALFGIADADLDGDIDVNDVWSAVVTTFIQPLLDLLQGIKDGLTTVLGPIFGGLDFNDLPTPAEVWQQVINTIMLPLNLLLGPNSPLNALNIFGRLGLGQFGSGVPIMALTTAVPNELEPFTAISVPSVDGWSFNAGQNAAQVVCDGSLKTLYLNSGVVKVEADQPLNTTVQVKYSGVTSGAGQTIRYVLECFATEDGSGAATLVTVGSISNPSGTISSPVTLGSTSWDIPDGVLSVRPTLVVDELVSAGTVYWLNIPTLKKTLLGVLSEGLPKAIQDRIDDMQATWDKFKGGVGGTVDDIEDALNGAGQAIRDAIANALGHAGTGHTSANILTYLQSIPQTVVSGLGDLNTLTNQIRDILAGLVVTPINSTVAAIKDWFTGVVGKTQNLTSGGTLPPTSVSGVGGASTIAEAIEETWNKFWDGINRTTGSTGKTTADVLSAATQVADAADTAQTSTETLAGFFNTPRLVPAWLATQADDASFATTLIDGSVAPTLGQIVLIPVQVTQDRIYDAIKFGITNTTMTNCYVGLYDCDESTGDLTKVLDLGDCKSQLNTTYNQQIVAIPSPISVQSGEVYYIAVLQVGGTAAAMHRWSSTVNFTTGLFPRYPGNVYATGSQTSMPSTIAVANVSSGARFWGGLGTATTPVAPGLVYISDSFNRANGTLTTPWTNRSGSLSIASNAIGSGDGTATHSTRLTSTNQRVGFTFAYSAGNAIGGALIRGNGSGNSVWCVIRSDGGTRVATISTTAGSYAYVNAATRVSTNVGATIGNWVFEAIGNTYALYFNGVFQTQWVDSGGAFSVGANSTEVGIFCKRNVGATYNLDNWFAQDL